MFHNILLADLVYMSVAPLHTILILALNANQNNDRTWQILSLSENNLTNKDLNIEVSGAFLKCFSLLLTVIT